MSIERLPQQWEIPVGPVSGSWTLFLSIQRLGMSSISLLNPKAEYMKKQQAMAVQITAATGMQEVLKTNLGNHFQSPQWQI